MAAGGTSPNVARRPGHSERHVTKRRTPARSQQAPRAKQRRSAPPHVSRPHTERAAGRRAGNVHGCGRLRNRPAQSDRAKKRRHAGEDPVPSPLALLYPACTPLCRGDHRELWPRAEPGEPYTVRPSNIWTRRNHPGTGHAENARPAPGNGAFT